MIHGEVIIDKAAFKLKEYSKIANKVLREAIEEEARYQARTLMKYTPPKTVKPLKDKIANQIDKVYLRRDELNDFPWKIEGVRKGIQKALDEKDQSALQSIFDRSPRLSQIIIEQANPARHKARRNRKTGNVYGRHADSAPVFDERGYKGIVKKRQGNVGLAKSGWGHCLKILKGTVPAWIARHGAKGSVKRADRGGDNLSISLQNKVSYMAYLNEKMKIVSRAIAGRDRALAKKIKIQLKLAAKGK